MSIGMTPFPTLYGYDTPSLVDLVFGERRDPKAKDWIIESQVDSQVVEREPTDDTKLIEDKCRQTQDRAQL
jgi:hypothetical protein